jgi:hypothetical protein
MQPVLIRFLPNGGEPARVNHNKKGTLAGALLFVGTAGKS